MDSHVTETIFATAPAATTVMRLTWAGRIFTIALVIVLLLLGFYAVTLMPNLPVRRSLYLVALVIGCAYFAALQIDTLFKTTAITATSITTVAPLTGRRNLSLDQIRKFAVRTSKGMRFLKIYSQKGWTPRIEIPLSLLSQENQADIREFLDRVDLRIADRSKSDA